MTLILALANSEYTIQISDRRLSGGANEDESNKGGVIVCLNARMSFGYTGLAKTMHSKGENFSTWKWLLQAINDSVSPDFTIAETLERLKNNATNTFRNEPILKNISKDNKRLAVMFTGFLSYEGGAMPVCAILSNYHDFKNNIESRDAANEFSIYYYQPIDGEINPTFVQRVGNGSAMTEEDVDGLRELLTLKKPSHALVGKALEVVRNIANRPKSSGTIGKQLTSIVIYRDFNLNMESTYSSDYVKSEMYMPAQVNLLPKQQWTVDNISLHPVDTVNTPPLSVPIVYRKRLCPCGSNKKYKHCHGRKST